MKADRYHSDRVLVPDKLPDRAPCPYCRTVVDVGVEYHVCDPCPACGRYVPRNNLSHHIEYDCPGHVRCVTFKESGGDGDKDSVDG
jgi:hypothetical protein